MLKDAVEARQSAWKC